MSSCKPWMLLLLAIMVSAPVAAQPYPAKPVRIVVSAAAGGSDDFHARLLARSLNEALGQQFLVDNRGGAGGLIGRLSVMKAAPDGYTLLLAGGTLTLAEYLYIKVPWDATRDFAPTSITAINQLVLVVHPSVPAKTTKEFIALARSQPRRLTFASTGAGQLPHLAGELFRSMARVDALHVPYKGAGAGVYVDLISGQIDFYFGVMTSALPHIGSGKLRPLAVTSASRSLSLPNIPTVAEAALPGYDLAGWYCLFAPAGTPREIIQLLNSALVKGIEKSDLRDAIIKSGLDPISSTPEQVTARLEKDRQRYGQIVKLAGIKPQ